MRLDSMGAQEKTIPVAGCDFSFFSRPTALIATVGETVVAGPGVTAAGEEQFAVYDGRKLLQFNRSQALDLAGLLSAWAGDEL